MRVPIQLLLPVPSQTWALCESIGVFATLERGIATMPGHRKGLVADGNAWCWETPVSHAWHVGQGVVLVRGAGLVVEIITTCYNE